MPAMQRVEAELGFGTLVGPEFTIKDPDRLAAKLAKRRAAEPERDADDLVPEIYDGVRYTFVFAHDGYGMGAPAVLDKLVDEGFELLRIANGWDRTQYKGVNTGWRDPATGRLFEVQLHTPASWAAKRRTYDAHREIGDPATPVARVERLRTHLAETFAAVPIPSRSAEIRSYRRHGW